jgi:hypothetical protein
VEEREDDVECKKWVLRVLNVLNHCRWSEHLICDTKLTLYSQARNSKHVNNIKKI